MATDPDDIRLSNDHRVLLANIADNSGRDWSEIFREAIVLWSQQRSLLADVQAAIHQADHGQLNDEDLVFEKLQRRAAELEDVG